jgi:glycosyltransferase involved in cell wall biosynthesis
MPFFSVVIPLYNKEKNIAATLKSALQQTFTDFEIIVIDDGSTDGSRKTALAFDDKRIRVIQIQNQGVSTARNCGIENAAGTLIAFLDADDYWFPAHLENLFRLYAAFPGCGLYATGYDRFYNEKKIIAPIFDGIPKDNWQGIVPDFFISSMVNRIAWTSAVAVPKSVLAEAGLFDAKLTSGEDLDLWIRIALKKPVAFCNIISARYCLNASNRISDSDILKNIFPKLDQFQEQETKDLSLKRFLDLYRAEFALKHKIAGDLQTFSFYKSQLDPGNISLKVRFVMALPVKLLGILFRIKKWLEKQNVLIDIYH